MAKILNFLSFDGRKEEEERKKERRKGVIEVSIGNLKINSYYFVNVKIFISINEITDFFLKLINKFFYETVFSEQYCIPIFRLLM